MVTTMASPSARFNALKVAKRKQAVLVDTDKRPRKETPEAQEENEEGDEEDTPDTEAVAETEGLADEAELPTELDGVKIEGLATGGKPPVRAEVPDAPPVVSHTSVISDTPTIASDEVYGNDEVALNQLLKLHPMLSLEATASKTLQMISGMVSKSSIQSCDLPVVPKSHDDLFLR